MIKHFPCVKRITGPLVAIVMMIIGHSAFAAAPAYHAVPALTDEGDAPYVYVCNQNSATVSVIDMQSLEVVETVDLKEFGFDKNAKPHHIAVEPDGSFWYVSLIGAGKVLKLNRSNELIGAIDFEAPGMLALHPSEDLLFVGRSMMAVNPPQRIGMIERSEMDIDEVDVFFPRPHALMVDPRGDYVYSGSLSVNQFLSMNVESGEVHLNTLEGDTHTLVQFALSPDGNTMVVTGQLTGKALIFDTSDPQNVELTQTIEVNDAPWHPMFTPDGNHVYFGNKQANTVTVLDMKEMAVKKVIEGEGLSQPHGLAISPDGKYVFVSNNNLAGGGMMMKMGDKKAAEGHEHHQGHDMAAMDKAEDQAGHMVVIETATNTIVKVIELEYYPTGVGAPLMR